MAIEELLGRTAELVVRRLAKEGAFVALDPADRGPRAETVLVPVRELPEGVREGDALTLFIYMDSEDRPIATTRAPGVELGQVAFLRCTDVTRFGAFVDWGLAKELLVPFAEQTSELRRGDLEPIGLLRDRSGRLAGTMRVRELLSERGQFAPGEWVHGEAWREEAEIGVFVILERRFVGLLPAHEPHALRRGQQAQFRVVHVLPDGKVELSLRGVAHEELAGDAARVLARLSTKGTPPVSDRSSPEAVRALFGLSKKAFKRAVGRLLKEGAVELDEHGTVRLRQPGP